MDRVVSLGRGEVAWQTAAPYCGVPAPAGTDRAVAERWSRVVEKRGIRAG